MNGQLHPTDPPEKWRLERRKTAAVTDFLILGVHGRVVADPVTHPFPEWLDRLVEEHNNAVDRP